MQVIPMDDNSVGHYESTYALYKIPLDIYNWICG